MLFVKGSFLTWLKHLDYDNSAIYSNHACYFQSDLDEMSNEAHLSDDKAKKAMVDAARIADELRGEQDVAQSFEKDRKLLECQVKDMQQRLDEAESNALKGGFLIVNLARQLPF